MIVWKNCYCTITSTNKKEFIVLGFLLTPRKSTCKLAN